MKKKSVPRNGIKEIQGEIKEIICKENEKKISYYCIPLEAQYYGVDGRK
jgi:hypothetical protein